MPRSIKIAAIQMDARPAPTAERLARAERLITQIVPSGVDLVVLPEIFNTGYEYNDENFQRAETLGGQTVAWLKNTAAQYRIHLAGSLMLLDRHDIYNALLLFAPDGRMWRYDKNYPWGWERAYFRGRKGISIARTDLGDIGFLICWDTAHRHLWQRYAGRVDLLVISSCPPDITNPTFIFRNGATITLEQFGNVGRRLQHTGRRLFGEMVNQQTAWLGVPAVQTVGAGHIRTAIPNGFLSLLSYLPVAPKLLPYLLQAQSLQMACDFVQGCKIVDSTGVVQTELEQAQGETFTLSEVTVPDKKTKPRRPQPPSLLPQVAYLSSDLVLPFLMRSVYRKGLRQARQRKEQV